MMGNQCNGAPFAMLLVFMTPAFAREERFEVGTKSVFVNIAETARFTARSVQCPESYRPLVHELNQGTLTLTQLQDTITHQWNIGSPPFWCLQESGTWTVSRTGNDCMTDEKPVRSNRLEAAGFKASNKLCGPAFQGSLLWVGRECVLYTSQAELKATLCSSSQQVNGYVCVKEDDSPIEKYKFLICIMMGITSFLLGIFTAVIFYCCRSLCRRKQEKPCPQRDNNETNREEGVTIKMESDYAEINSSYDHMTRNPAKQLNKLQDPTGDYAQPYSDLNTLTREARVAKDPPTVAPPAIPSSLRSLSSLPSTPTENLYNNPVFADTLGTRNRVPDGMDAVSDHVEHEYNEPVFPAHSSLTDLVKGVKATRPSVDGNSVQSGA